MRIGVDFDNTIAGYDRVFTTLALEAGLLDEAPAGGKRGVRDALRRRPGGDEAWQKLQAEAYGARMAEAELIPGVADFFTACRARRVPVHIVSHKTRYARYDVGGVDLRHAALDWMEGHGFFAADGFGLRPGQVFFEPSRGTKLSRIAALGVSHFVDDLEEVFNEAAFPADVEAILYLPEAPKAPEAGPARRLARYTSFADWGAITEYCLGTRH